MSRQSGEGTTRRHVFSGILLSVSASVSLAAPPADGEIEFDIAPQSVESALLAFSEQADIQVMVSSASIKGQRTGGVKGRLDVPSALGRLLQNTNLTHQAAGNAVAVVRVAAVTDGKQARPSGASSSGQPAASTDERRGGLQVEEVIVTAQKRAESVQDVPISISVVSSEDINQRGLVSADDYLRGVPGVNQGTSFSGSSVIIRGLETTVSDQNFASGPTAAIYFGETPTTDSGGISGNGTVDIKLVDIERVEILRGPQGTAFGSASLGGAVRTIPAAPNLDRFEGAVAANLSLTSGTGGENSMIQGVANVPLIDEKLAVRAVAYRYEDSGIYRNVAGSDEVFRAAAAAYGQQTLDFAHDHRDIGASVFNGARAAALLKLTETLSFTLSYLTQTTQTDGMPLANTGDGYDQAVLELAPEHVRRGQRIGVTDSDIDLANLTMDADLGWANLIGTVSYVKSGSLQTRPYSMLGKSFIYAGPLSNIALNSHRQHTGEIRLVTQLAGSWEFLGGFYLEKLEDETEFPYIWHGDLATSPFGPLRLLGDGRDYDDRRDLTQRALFAEGSWEFLPAWTFTGGVRAYEYERHARVETRGALFTDRLTETVAEESDANFRANLSYRPNADSLIYASWAQGFRLGKPQPGLPAGLCDRDGDGVVDGSSNSIDSTTKVESDSVDSTEVGGKFALLEGRLVIDAAAFSIDWTGVPLLTVAPLRPTGCGLNYVTNAGMARSQGIETQLKLQMSSAWRLDVGGSYIQAELAKVSDPTSTLSRGDRLPGSPKLNANLGLQYGLSILGREALLRADSLYVGRFSSTLPYSTSAEAGDYVKVDLSMAVSFGDLRVDLFVRNLTNADDLTFMDAFGEQGYRLRPRTTGLQLGYTFK